MNLLVILILSLPIILLITLFIGIVKNNKRLWITSLIFFIVVVLLESAFFLMYERPVVKTTETVTNQKEAN